MTLAPSWEQQQAQARRRAEHEARETYLSALADHVGGPSENTWQALRRAASGLDEAEDRPFGFRHGDAVGGVAEALIADEPGSWARLMAQALDWAPGMLSDGGGARLKALSPFAGRAILTCRGGAVGGEVGILFENALGRAGADTSPGTSYVLAIDPEALDAAGIAVTGA